SSPSTGFSTASNGVNASPSERRPSSTYQQVRLAFERRLAMRVIKSAFLFVVTVSLAAAVLMPPRTIQSVSAEAAALPASSYEIPFAPNNDGVPAQQSMNDFYEFAWQSFVALNWPALEGGDRGQPDT